MEMHSFEIMVLAVAECIVQNRLVSWVAYSDGTHTEHYKFMHMAHARGLV